MHGYAARRRRRRHPGLNPYQGLLRILPRPSIGDQGYGSATHSVVPFAECTVVSVAFVSSRSCSQFDDCEFSHRIAPASALIFEVFVHEIFRYELCVWLSWLAK